MDDDGSLGFRNWEYYEQPMKGSLGFQQLMSSGAERRTTKPLLSNGAFLHRDCSVPEPSVPFQFVPDAWAYHNRDPKPLSVMPLNQHSSYGVLPTDPAGAHTLHMIPPPDPPEEEEAQLLPDVPKKRHQGRPSKQPKAKKQKKPTAPRDEAIGSSVSRAKAGNKSTGLIINGIDLDISGIATPVCSCTGPPQQCYKWGAGGWQSACCTTNISAYPLPMSTKRRGARIAGRKMSLGAFKKVLEKLAGEGCNLSNPIDLKTFWAKHGTNKFVTIR